MDNQLLIDHQELTELQNMVLLVLQYDQLLHFLFLQSIPEYSTISKFQLRLSQYRMLRCSKECKIADRKLHSNFLSKANSFLTPFLIIQSSKSKEQISLIRYCLWEVILTHGILDLKLVLMMMEEDSLLASRQ